MIDVHPHIQSDSLALLVTRYCVSRIRSLQLSSKLLQKTANHSVFSTTDDSLLSQLIGHFTIAVTAWVSAKANNVDRFFRGNVYMLELPAAMAISGAPPDGVLSSLPAFAVAKATHVEHITFLFSRGFARLPRFLLITLTATWSAVLYSCSSVCPTTAK